jgi:hypothetical protein
MVFGIFRSLALWLRGLLFCITWMEKKNFKKAPDAKKYLNGKILSERTLIFIRHGESDWNEIFNKEKALLLPRLFFGLLREFTKCFHSQDSVFLDSPLSLEGCDQADDLREHLFRTGDPKKDVSVRVARLGTPKDSILVASNLRRAVHTGLIALYPRLERNKNEKILLRAELQEMSRNVDTESITSKGQVPVVDVVDQRIGKSSAQWLDASQNTGNKQFCKSAKPRFDAFCKWACEQDQETIVVAAGHSLWFREFFKLYLPTDSPHIARKEKMLNCASVSFNLCQAQDGPGNIGWFVKESTISEDHRGFKRSSKKSKAKMILGMFALAIIVALSAFAVKNELVPMSSVCTPGIAALRGGSVIFAVASLATAGMYTCTGKPTGKLLAITFYAFIFYIFAVYAPKWCGATSDVVTGAADALKGAAVLANAAAVVGNTDL